MKVTHSEVLIPAELGAAARGRLIDDLYRVHVEIFDGVERSAFAAYVVESPAEHTSILVHRDPSGNIVGYFAEHEFHRVLHGRRCVVLRGEAGLLRAFRGSQSNLRFGLGVAARLLLEAPNRPVYYLGCLVHPSSYYQLARYMRPVWPSREVQPDDATRALMAGLADSFKLRCVADDPLVRKVGWRTRDSDAERGYWQRCPRPEARFFRAANPGYGEGHGLVTLAPVSMTSISGVLARIAGEKAARNMSTARGSLRRLPVLSRWLGPAEVAKHLRAAPLFEGLGEAQIAALTAHAEVIQLPAGQVLFSRGDLGGDLYIIVGGGVHVTAQADGEEEVLDQLDPGDVFGEIAALTGEARTATIRTATRCTLIRLERGALRNAMAGDPALGEAVWSRFVARRFEDATAGVVAFAGTTRESRGEHLARGTTSLLAPGARQTWRGAGHVFVADGEVEVFQGPTRMRGRAPLLVELAGELELVARTHSRVVRVPAMQPSPDEVRQFRRHPLLARLDDVAFAAVFAAAQPVRVLAGQVLFAHGDVADAFYLVRTGAVEIEVDGSVITTLGPGECFGERAFDPGQSGRRTAGARASTPSELLRLPGKIFVEQISPQLFVATPATSERLRDDLAGLLAAAWTEAPAELSETRQLSAGEVVVREGEPGDAAWFVLEGLLQVVRGGEVVDRIGPGECFGERSLLLQAPRNATVVAQTPVLAQRVAAAAFLAWSAGQPRLHDLLATLSHVHTNNGESTTVHTGTYDGHPSVTSLTRLADGRIFSATKLLDQPVLLLASDDGGGPAITQVEHMRAPPGTRRRLGVRDDRPRSLLLEGDLSAAAVLGERLRGGQPLTRGELERFRWTGELGAPASGPRRLLCGCLGLTRAELDALPTSDRCSLAAVCRRTGAGSVCGGCIPLIRRIVVDPRAEAPTANDEVDLAAFEARLDSQRHLDTSRSLVGPDTATWRVFGESVVLLGGARALLMQFAHPLVQSLTDHSTFLKEPGDRFHRTLQSMYGLAFGDGPTMLRMAREVHEKHARVAGSYQRTVGPYRAGDRYSANQVPLLLWVAATVTDTTVQTYEALVGPLSLADKDRLISEAAGMYGLFGLPRERHPADWRSFRAYVDGMLASDSLQVGEQARALARAVLTAPKPGSEPAYAVLRRLTATWLPPALRAGYGMEEGPLGRAASATLAATIRTAVPRLPHALRICPARLHAERRIRGETGPDPGGARIEQLLASLLGVAGSSPHTNNARDRSHS